MDARRDGTRASLALIGFIVFIDMAGIGLILPVMPDLVIGLTGVTIDRAAEIGGWLFFSYAIMQFLWAPIIGGLSDRYGRRPVLLFTLTALGLDYALMAWAPTLAWLFVGRLISGVMGATWAAANSCVADTVRTEDRGRVFGILGACGAAGFVLGPAIGGLLGGFGVRLPFIAASILALSGAAIGWFVLKETLPPERRRRFALTRANPLGSILQLSKTPLVLGCLIAIFLMQLASQASVTVWAYYGIEKFAWSTLTIGLTVTLYGTLLALSQGVATGLSIRRFGAVPTAAVALLFAIPSYLILAFAASTTHMIIGILVGAVAGMTFPAMQQLMTARIGEDAQGELQGAIASTISLTSVLGPPLMTGIFGAYADDSGLYFPGAPFVVAAALTAAAAIMLILTLKRTAGLR
ncbi:MAG: TCR/Tet family MFS transporter [Parasphingopyxis sp.]|uniref:TCR/Tet family MFS transporter n=1 Tax=Parasphingopyxis sp. TaxID=1920299 RepID=UPI003FA103B9